MMEDSYLALDLGATKLLVGEVDAAGNILNFKRYPSGRLDQAQAVELIVRSLDDYIATVGWHGGQKPVAMGVGLLGRVDSAEGMWLQIDPARTSPTPLARILSERYAMPCRIDNDVKSATRAVGRWEHPEARNYIYINVGTGIAAGTVVNGSLVRGSHHNAGEVGHTNVGVDAGLKCGCGRDNCVELIAGGVGFDASARQLAGTLPTRLSIPREGRLDVRDVYRLADQGDELCVRLVENASRGIANLIMNMVRTTDPELVVLGGGVVSSGWLMPRILERLTPSAVRFVTGGIVLTGLDPAFVGLLGAAAIAMN